MNGVTLDVFTMTIGGAAHAGNGTLDVINPATGSVIALAPSADAADLNLAVDAAREALPSWRASPIADRRAALFEASEVIKRNADELAHLFVLEHGRPLNGAKGEILAAAQWLKQIAKQDLPVEVTEDTAERRVEVHLEPLGVVCAIVPWNFPVLLAAWKIAPALLAGNTMVLKPSPFTPLCTLKLGQLLRDVFPAGVLNVVSGGDDLGPMMTGHPGFAKITFTGSTATGKRIMASAAADLKRLTLELGGNDAAIVLPDANLDAFAEEIFRSAFNNTGQVCVATKRLYVHEQIYDDLLERLHAILLATKVGDGFAPDSMFGPIQNAAQYERVCGLIADAEKDGLKLLRGSTVPEQGYFVPLTIVDNPPEDSRVVQEEAFGPVLPMMRFSDIDDVIDRANATEFGLAGSVWSSDIDAAIEIAHRLETGTVWINTKSQSSWVTPLGGHKHSGFGVENGFAGLLEFTQKKVIYIPKSAP